MSFRPLAERLRPTSIDDYIGQEHLVSPNAPLRKAFDKGFIPNMILWGPPGVGKQRWQKLLPIKLNDHFMC